MGTTVSFVPQVLGPLVRAGWVQSDPGPTGGYLCRVPLGDVSVLQVIEAVDGATDVGRCVVADRPCQAADPCVLHVAWAAARNELVGVLQSTPMSGVESAVAVMSTSQADRVRRRRARAGVRWRCRANTAAGA